MRIGQVAPWKAEKFIGDLDESTDLESTDLAGQQWATVRRAVHSYPCRPGQFRVSCCIFGCAWPGGVLEATVEWGKYFASTMRMVSPIRTILYKPLWG